MAKLDILDQNILRRALFFWMTTNNPAELINCLELTSVLHFELEKMFLEQGSNPQQISFPYAGSRWSLHELITKLSSELMFAADRVHHPEFLWLEVILNIEKINYDDLANAALQCVQAWIHNHFMLNNAQHSQYVADCYIIYKTRQELSTYKPLLLSANMLTIEEMENFLISCQTYDNAILQLTDSLPRPNIELLNLAIKIRQGIKTSRQDSLTDWIENFFGVFFTSSNYEINLESAFVYKMLRNPEIQNKIIVDDDTLRQWTVDNISKENNQYFLDVTPYYINRILLSAVLQKPEKWTPSFAQMLQDILNFIKSLDPQLNHNQRLIISSYPESLCTQIDYLINMYQFMHVDGVSRPIRPKMALLLPEQIQNTDDWFNVAVLLDEQDYLMVYTRLQVLIERILLDAIKASTKNIFDALYFIPREKQDQFLHTYIDILTVDEIVVLVNKSLQHHEYDYILEELFISNYVVAKFIEKPYLLLEMAKNFRVKESIINNIDVEIIVNILAADVVILREWFLMLSEEIIKIYLYDLPHVKLVEYIMYDMTQQFISYNILINSNMFARLLLSDLDIDTLNDEFYEQYTDYAIKSIMLHAFIQAPQFWTPVFAELVSKVLMCLQSSRQADFVIWLEKFKYLNEIYLSNNPIRPKNMLLILPSQIETAYDWIEVSALVDFETRHRIYQRLYYKLNQILLRDVTSQDDFCCVLNSLPSNQDRREWLSKLDDQKILSIADDERIVIFILKKFEEKFIDQSVWLYYLLQRSSFAQIITHNFETLNRVYIYLEEESINILLDHLKSLSFDELYQMHVRTPELDLDDVDSCSLIIYKTYPIINFCDILQQVLETFISDLSMGHNFSLFKKPTDLLDKKILNIVQEINKETNVHNKHKLLCDITQDPDLQDHPFCQKLKDYLGILPAHTSDSPSALHV